MTLDRDRPEILTPLGHPPTCCTQQTITIPADVLAKTAETRLPVGRAPPLLRRAHRRRARLRHRQGPRHNDIARGWCCLMGLTPLMLFTAALLIVRDQRILAAWNAR